MKSKFLRVITAGVLLTLSGTINIANAEYMVDTDNDSFIDTTTGLEWMDFGINNGQSYNYVASQLGEGGIYEGWSLPTAAEAYEVWTNAYAGYDSDYENLNQFGGGQFHIFDKGEVYENIWRHNSEVMGYNWLRDYEGQNERRYSLGSFIRGDGYTLGHISALDYTSSNNDDVANIYGRHTAPLTTTTISNDYATLLYKETEGTDEVVDVNEPATLAIFALGIIGLRMRRFKKQEFTRFTG